MATDIEKLLQEIQSLPAQERQRLHELLGTNANGSSDVAGTENHTEDEYQDLLVRSGLLERKKPRQRDQRAFDRFKPVPISGQPISETIVEERK